MKKKKQIEAEAVKKEPELIRVTVTDLSAAEAIFSEPVKVVSIVRGRALEFSGRRLTPGESRQVQLLLERALPPVISEAGKEPVYNLADAEYKKAHEGFRRQGRAQALWLAYPIFREALERENAKLEVKVKPPGNPEEVEAWFDARPFDDDCLNDLFAALTDREVQSYVGFTFGNSSPKS